MGNSIGLAIAAVAVGAATVTAQEPTSTWTLNLSVRESNQLWREVDGIPQEDRILDNANFGLEFMTRTERARFGLFGRAGANVYREGEQSDRMNYGGGFSWELTPSERLVSTVTAGVTRDFRAQTLSELAVLAPDIRSFGANASWDLQYLTSPRTTLFTSVSYTRRKFETDSEFSGSQLVLEGVPFDDLFRPLDEFSREGDLVLRDAEDDVLRILATEGISSRETSSHWLAGTFGLSSRVTQRTALGFDLAGGYRSIAAQRSDRRGADSGGRFWVQRDVGTGAQLSAHYSLRHSVALEPSTVLQSLMGGVSYSTRGGRMSVSLEGGASLFQAGELPSVFTPGANTSLSLAITSNTRFRMSYRRQFQQSVGFGKTLLIDFGSLSLSQSFGSRVTATALAGGSFGTNPLVEDSRYDARRAGATVNVRVFGPLSAGTSFFALSTDRRDEVVRTESTRDIWNVYLNFTKSWH